MNGKPLEERFKSVNEIDDFLYLRLKLAWPFFGCICVRLLHLQFSKENLWDNWHRQKVSVK